MIKVGTLFAGRYGIISQIGSGGMADVYKVQDVETNRTIALKVLKESLSRDADSIRRFKAEGERMKEIQSQNVVTVYDVGSVGGTYYIAMELINGITLKEYIRRKGQLSPKETMAVSAQVACGLRAAHSRQIVHRDVKPQNIILSKDGKVKVMDFGIAESTDTGAKNSQFTVGSVYYIAPEQAKGEACDERSDIYSLGVVMYEMITGKVPFDKETTVQVALAHMNESMTPPSELNPECPLALEQIIFRCTQKSRARRYHNCTELLGDLKIAVGTPDYDFGQKEKATLMKNNTQVFTKNEPRPKPVAPMTGDVRRPHPTRQSAHEEEDETEVRAAHKPAKKPLPKTLFDRIIQILGAIIAAVILFLLIYIIVSLSGCNKKPVQ